MDLANPDASVRFSRTRGAQMYMKRVMNTSFRHTTPKTIMRARRTSGPHKVAQHIPRTLLHNRIRYAEYVLFLNDSGR
jgi:hypothetical protein